MPNKKKRRDQCQNLVKVQGLVSKNVESARTGNIFKLKNNE